ncbi:MAG: carbohydrate binding domain-containing protein [Candidatus Poribacteria bacterium]|nr:carbohydrate binding domain-containing protein [Candidatus Poribacteria bacterium]
MRSKTLRLMLALLAIPFAAMAQDVENLIVNSSFEDDQDNLGGGPGWALWTGEGASANFEYDPKEAIDGETSMRVEITQGSATNWHIGLTQTGIALEGSETYTLSFWAKSEGTRVLAMELKREPGGQPWQGITDDGPLLVQEEWLEFTNTFIAPRDYPEENGLPAQLNFWLADDEETIWFDFVYLYEGEYQEIEPSEGPKAVDPSGKMATSWARLKRL